MGCVCTCQRSISLETNTRSYKTCQYLTEEVVITQLRICVWMNRLKRYLPFSAMKLMYDSLILSHLQFGITCWGFEWNRILKLQKRALRIMTNSKYNAHTEPLFKELEMLKVKNIFDVQYMKFWYKFVNKSLPEYLARCFHSIMNYTKSKHVVRTNSICFLPGLSALAMFWDIISQTCCKNILGP